MGAILATEAREGSDKSTVAMAAGGIAADRQEEITVSGKRAKDIPESLPNIVAVAACGSQVRSSDDGVVTTAQLRHPQKVTAQPPQQHRRSRFLVERDLSVQARLVKLNAEVVPTSPPQNSEGDETYRQSMPPSAAKYSFHDEEIRWLAFKALDAHLRRFHAHDKVVLLDTQNAGDAEKQNLFDRGNDGSFCCCCCCAEIEQAVIDTVRSDINHHTNAEDAVLDGRKSGTRHRPDDSENITEHISAFTIVTTKTAHPVNTMDVISSYDDVTESSDDFARVLPPYSAPEVKPLNHCQCTLVDHDHEKVPSYLESDGRRSHCKDQRRQRTSTSTIGYTVGHAGVGVDDKALKGGRRCENSEKDAGDDTDVSGDKDNTDSRLGGESIRCCQLCQLCKRQDVTAGLSVEDGNGSGTMKADGSLGRLAIHHPTEYAPPCRRLLAYMRGCSDTIFL